MSSDSLVGAILKLYENPEQPPLSIITFKYIFLGLFFYSYLILYTLLIFIIMFTLIALSDIFNLKLYSFSNGMLLLLSYTLP
jgi:hypothetical protein